MIGWQKKSVSLREEKGSLLFMLLFFLAVLMILGAAFLKDSFNERAIAKNYLHKVKSHYLAEAGVEFALALLGEEPEYFLEGNFGQPVYFNSRAGEEEYFVLQWLKPGIQPEEKRYYTLISNGFYRHHAKNKKAESEIKALLDVRQKTVVEEEPEGVHAGEGTGQIEFVLIRLIGVK